MFSSRIFPVVILFMMTSQQRLTHSKSQESRYESGEVGHTRRSQRSRNDHWTSWGTWSACTQSCGFGISIRMRECEAGRSNSRSSRRTFRVTRSDCVGLYKQIRTCNTQSPTAPKMCYPGQSTSRARQCSEFNHQKFRGEMYQWEPFINTRSQCELTCRAKGYRFYAKLAATVADGTPCVPGSGDICLAGDCVKVGCDGIVGSPIQFDPCGVCDGDGSTCKLITGIYSQSGFTVSHGYHMIVKIAAGATGINISEVHPSRNYLALKIESGDYIFNGHQRLSHLGEYFGAGTKFSYAKGDGRWCPGQCIYSDGPTTSPIQLQLLYYSRNPGVRYQFSIPVTASQKGELFTYLSENENKNQPLTSNTDQHGTLDNNYSDEEHDLDSESEALTSALSDTSVTDISNDSSVLDLDIIDKHGISSNIDKDYFIYNKSDGSRMRNDTDVVIDSGLSTVEPLQNDDQAAKDSFNEVDNEKSKMLHNKRILQKTNKRRNPFKKYTQSFNRRFMSTTHDYKKQRRPYRPNNTRRKYYTVNKNRHPPVTGSDVTRRIHPSNKDVQSLSSHEISSRRYHKSRMTQPAQKTHVMRVDPTSRSKSKPRGLNHRTSSHRVSNEIPRKWEVTAKDREKLIRRYNRRLSKKNQVVDSDYVWKVTGLTDCDATCGGGYQETIIVCIMRTSQVIVTDENCDTRKPRRHVVICNQNTCPPGWQTSEWGECSATCGDSFRDRTVECKQRLSPGVSVSVSAEKCNQIGAQPDNVETCNVTDCFTWSVGNWTECSAICGKGELLRDVTCMNLDGNNVDETNCVGSKAKPDDTQICDMGSCGTGWFYTEWPETCLTSCGVGAQRRHLHCSGENGGSLDNTKCDHLQAPNTERTCSVEQPCGGTWFSGTWTMCNSTCGEGVQSRDVACMKKVVGELAIVPESNCLLEDRPNTTQICPGLPECPAEWYISDWNQCSVSCGLGYQTRESKCLDMDQQQSMECDHVTKPITRQSCNEQRCDMTQMDEACTDRFARCPMVVQARLCRYSYYMTVCCASCTSGEARILAEDHNASLDKT